MNNAIEFVWRPYRPNRTSICKVVDPYVWEQVNDMRIDVGARVDEIRNFMKRRLRIENNKINETQG